ncbi:hypothetical protein ACIQRW_18285 [Streptomyces sp. NPDC091287]
MSDFNMGALLEGVALSATLLDSRSKLIWRATRSEERLWSSFGHAAFRR